MLRVTTAAALAFLLGAACYAAVHYALLGGGVAILPGRVQSARPAAMVGVVLIGVGAVEELKDRRPLWKEEIPHQPSAVRANEQAGPSYQSEL